MAPRARFTYSTVLFIILSALLLVLGSVHTHERDPGGHPSIPHECFLCQVLPNLEVDMDVAGITPEASIVAVPPAPSPVFSKAPVCSTGTPRSPPA